jgi:hypothetical protein
MFRRLFRHRRIARLFPIGCAVALILGVLAGSALAPAVSLGLNLLVGVGLGLVISLLLYGVPIFTDRRL